MKLEESVSYSEADESKPKHSLSILVLDDEIRVCQLLHDVLVQEGHQVATFTSGLAAIEAAKHERFDMVFLDLRMPEMAGPEVLNALQPHLPRAIFVVMTAYADSEMIEQSLGDGALLCLHKPISIAQLIELVACMSGKVYE